jgi:hypothetical protein
VPVDHLPTGHLDAVRVLAGNHVEVIGWAFDPDAATAVEAVSITLGGTSGSEFKAVSIAAGQSRPDVGRVYPAAGANHGFDTVISTLPGTYPVCAYATNNYLYGANRLLGCMTARL